MVSFMRWCGKKHFCSKNVSENGAIYEMVWEKTFFVQKNFSEKGAVYEMV